MCVCPWEEREGVKLRKTVPILDCECCVFVCVCIYIYIYIYIMFVCPWEEREGQVEEDCADTGL